MGGKPQGKWRVTDERVTTQSTHIEIALSERNLITSRNITSMEAINNLTPCIFQNKKKK